MVEYRVCQNVDLLGRWLLADLNGWIVSEKTLTTNKICGDASQDMSKAWTTFQKKFNGILENCSSRGLLWSYECSSAVPLGEPKTTKNEIKESLWDYVMRSYSRIPAVTR